MSCWWGSKVSKTGGSSWILNAAPIMTSSISLQRFVSQSGVMHSCFDSSQWLLVLWRKYHSYPSNVADARRRPHKVCIKWVECDAWEVHNQENMWLQYGTASVLNVRLASESKGGGVRNVSDCLLNALQRVSHFIYCKYLRRDLCS